MKLKIGTKLILGFMGVALIAAIIGIVGIFSMKTVSDYLHEIDDVRLPSIQSLLMIYEAQSAIEAAEHSLLAITSTPEMLREAYGSFDATWQRVSRYWAIYEPLPQTAEEEVMWKQFVPLWERWKKDHEEFVRLSRIYWADRTDANYSRMADQSLIINEASLDAAHEPLAGIVDLNKDIAVQVGEESDRAVAQGNMILVIVLVLGIIIAVFLGVFLTNAIRNPLLKGVEFAQKVSQGDLTASVDVKTGDELQTLGDALNEMVKNLNATASIAEKIAGNDLSVQVQPRSDKDTLNISFRKMVANLREMAVRINDAADQVASSSEELSKTAQNLSEGSQKQAASLEETSAAMEEMSASVQQVSEKAQNQASSVEEVTSSMEEMSSSVKNTAELAASVRSGSETSVSLAVEAEKSSVETMGAMKGIEESANKIKNIIDVISDIADQTNLLALNASIEAARAGDAGRGFAVVAKEISKLADKSAEATKEIEDLINETGRTVDSGVDKVKSVDQSIRKIREAAQSAANFGNTMAQASEEQLAAARQISEAVQNVNTMAQNIAAASEEQASTSAETGKTIEGVSSITQQNAASSEEMASSTEELSSLAENMKKLVSQFKIS